MSDYVLSSGNVRPSHAYIVSGPTFFAERTAAEIASAIVCSSDSKRPCGVCRDCRKAKDGVHPDINEVHREEDKKEIRVEAARAVRAEASVMPNEAERKVFVIFEADTMNDSAQNALLKVLEEPPASAAFVLIAENTGALLETVRSRCIEVRAVPDAGAEEKIPRGADRLVSVLLEGDPLTVTALMFELEQMQRLELTELVRGAGELVVRQMRDPLSDREKLLKIKETFDTALMYFERNVSVGHAAGMMLARFV